ncbi:MAG: glycoside hydrolase family 3 C-terminal domain-containing protein [Bacteroidales bacterium]|nr:glycoside hydrolase family 3 C-terminal domain-containing protein [Bacteroidales bacterium]
MKRLITTAIAIMTLTATLTAQPSLQKLEDKAKTLISQMTLDEKISQMMNATPGIERLGIEPYDYWNEGLHGVGRNGRATVFPQPIGLGATFDPQLVKQIGEVISTESRAKYYIARRNKNYSRYTGLTFWSPNINIFRDPRWGRGMETYGEDPYLTGTLGTYFVKGMQGDDPVYLKVAACGKHFAVHSGPEATRHEANIDPTKRDLWETYLPAFKMLVQDAKVEIIMGAYNRVYGESCSGSKFLLTDVLRNQWGFKGHIVSDCDAVDDIYKGHGIVKTAAEASAVAVKAGLNIECGHSFTALKDAVKQNLITEKDLDEALLPLMMTRLKLGIIDKDDNCPYNNFTEKDICKPEHTALSKKAALESMVLLKNNGILPLKKDIHRLFVTGAGAADAFWLMGNYFGISDRYCTYLQGIISKVSDGTAVNFRPGVLENAPTTNPINYAINESARSQYTVIVMGNNGNLEGEEGEAIDSRTKGDRVSTKLPESQMNFLRQIAERKKMNNARNGDNSNKGIIVVLTGGSPIDVREITEIADAVIMAWYSGQEGGYALGDLLFGDANFSGRLPITFPADSDKLPDFEDYTMKGRTYKYMTDNIFYPFGYGLSYSKVDYSNLSAVWNKDKTLSVKVSVSNTSNIKTTETVQVYISAPGAGENAPLQQLAAFRRVEILPGQTTEASFEIPADRLMTVEEDGTSKLRSGNYTITAAGAAPSSRTQELGVGSVSTVIKVK